MCATKKIKPFSGWVCATNKLGVRYRRGGWVCTTNTTAAELDQAQPTQHITSTYTTCARRILRKNTFNSKLRGNKISFKMLLAKDMLCSQLHYQKVLDRKSFQLKSAECGGHVTSASASILPLSASRSSTVACFRVSGSGFRVQGSGLRAQGSGFRIQGSGFRVQGSAFRVSGFQVQRFLFQMLGSGFRVSGSGFRVSCFIFRVSGSKFRVPG